MRDRIEEQRTTRIPDHGATEMWETDYTGWGGHEEQSDTTLKEAR